MNKKESCFLLMFFFSSLAVFSQNYRDKTINENIHFRMQTKDKEYYLKTKEAILKLENDYGYEVDLKVELIDYSYRFDDLDFFKEQLSILVEKHGFDISYLEGKESYYDAIIKGGLSGWFKEMYLKNHFVWMQNNFEKQIDQRKLHDIELKNQVLRSFTWNDDNRIAPNSDHAKAFESVRNESLFRNISGLYAICRKYDYYPTGKNFGVLYNYYNSGITSNLQIKENMERTWLLFEPFIRKSYMRNEMDYNQYRNYDAFSYIHFGYQKYGLMTKELLPLYIYPKETEITEIPIKNAFFAEKMKREMGW